MQLVQLRGDLGEDVRHVVREDIIARQRGGGLQGDEGADVGLDLLHGVVPFLDGLHEGAPQVAVARGDELFPLVLLGRGALQREVRPRRRLLGQRRQRQDRLAIELRELLRRAGHHLRATFQKVWGSAS